MKFNLHESVHNLRNNQDFIKIMATIHDCCAWDSIHTKESGKTIEEFNGQRCVWAGIRQSFGLDPETLHAIEHFKYNKQDD